MTPNYDGGRPRGFIEIVFAKVVEPKGGSDVPRPDDMPPGTLSFQILAG